MDAGIAALIAVPLTAAFGVLAPLVISRIQSASRLQDRARSDRNALLDEIQGPVREYIQWCYALERILPSRERQNGSDYGAAVRTVGEQLGPTHLHLISQFRSRIDLLISSELRVVLLFLDEMGMQYFGYQLAQVFAPNHPAPLVYEPNEWPLSQITYFEGRESREFRMTILSRSSLLLDSLILKERSAQMPTALEVEERIHGHPSWAEPPVVYLPPARSHAQDSMS